MKSGTSCTFVFASILSVTSLALLALGFGTDNWTETLVDRAALKLEAVGEALLLAALREEPVFFTRYRGLFRTCFSGNETRFLETSPDVVDASCLVETGYELPRRPHTLNYGENYEAHIHLMRCHFAMLTVAMLFIFAACVLGVVGCWNSRPGQLRTTGIIMLFGMLFIAAGMAFFHGLYFIEINVLKAPGFQAYIEDSNLNKYVKLSANSRAQYGYSYIITWVSLGCAGLAAVMYLIVAYRVSEDIWRQKGVPEDRRYRNRAYMDRSQALDERSERPPPVERNSTNYSYEYDRYPHGYGYTIPYDTYAAARY